MAAHSKVFSKVIAGLALASGGALGLVHAQQVNERPVLIVAFTDHLLFQTRSPICMRGVPVTCALVQMHRHMCMCMWASGMQTVFPTMSARHSILSYSALGMTEAFRATTASILAVALGCHTRSLSVSVDCVGCRKPQEYMVPWLGGSIPESTHDKYWESAFYNRLLVRALISHV